MDLPCADHAVVFKLVCQAHKAGFQRQPHVQLCLECHFYYHQSTIVLTCQPCVYMRRGGTPVSFRLVRTCFQNGMTYSVLTQSNSQGPPSSAECRCPNSQGPQLQVLQVRGQGPVVSFTKRQQQTSVRMPGEAVALAEKQTCIGQVMPLLLLQLCIHFQHCIRLGHASQADADCVPLFFRLPCCRRASA